MKLIIGLGNPGDEYRNTRHNVGFHVVDDLRRRHGGTVQQRFKGELCRTTIVGERCLLVKPLTYMNRSGIAVALVTSYFDIPVSDLIVVHDEVDFPFATLRIKQGGGTAGHKGLRSILESVGSAEFTRVRVGVGRPSHGDVANYVLSGVARADQALWDDVVARAATAVEDILSSSVLRAMNHWNGAAGDPPT